MRYTNKSYTYLITYLLTYLHLTMKTAAGLRFVHDLAVLLINTDNNNGRPVARQAVVA